MRYFVGPDNSWVTTESEGLDPPSGFTEVPHDQWEAARSAQEAAVTRAVAASRGWRAKREADLAHVVRLGIPEDVARRLFGLPEQEG